MKRGERPGEPDRPAEKSEQATGPKAAEDRPTNLESFLDDFRRGATAWPSTHRKVFDEALDKLREASEEVQLSEEALRQQNEELSAAQLEAVIARERYAELFNFAPAAHLVTDLEGTILEANLAATILLGVAHKTLFGKPLPGFVPNLERRAFRSRLARIAGEGQVLDWALRLKPRDGPAFDAAATVAVFRDSDGKRAELRWMVQDVSERVRAEQAVGRDLELHRQVVETAGDLITVFDPEGKIVLASPSWEAMLGYRPEDVMGRTWLELIHPEDLADVTTGLRQTLDSGRGTLADVRVRHKDGRWIHLETSQTTVYDQLRQPVRIVATSRDISTRKRIKEEREELLMLEQTARAEAEAAGARVRKLQVISDALLAHVDLDDLLRELLDAVRAALGSDTATILLVTPDGKQLAVRAVRGEEAARGEVRVPLGQGIAGRIATERRPRIVPDVPQAKPYSAALRTRIKSLVGVPLVVGEEVIGVLHAGTLHRHQFTDEDIRLLQLVAERAAVAIENAGLYESEQEAKRVAVVAARRAAGLQQVTAALSEAITTDQVAGAILDRGAQALGAAAAMMALVSEDATTLEIVRAIGYPEQMVSAWRRFPVSAHLPLSDAVSSGRPVLLESTGAREVRYPALRSTLDLPDHAVAAIPMALEGRPLGGLVFRFSAPRTFEDIDVQFMEALGRQSALALERARLYEAEQLARREAELAQLRLAFLAEAGTILAGSLQIPEALESLGRLAVTFLTDLCLIDVLEENGSIRRMVAVHADAEKQPLADLLRTRYSPDPTGTHPAIQVMLTGQPNFSAEMPEDFLRRTTRDEEHYRVVRELGFQSFMCVPLITRGRVRGSFTLVSCNPDRRYGPGDVALAEELARRAAFAVDNALLYEGEQRARQEAEVAASRLALVAEASEALASSLDYRVTLQAIAQLVVPRLADWCMVDLLAEDGSLHQTAVAHRDPSKVALASELRDRYPPDRVPPHPVWRVLLSGRPELAEEITTADLEARAKDSEHLRLLRQIDIRSHMVVPLAARGRILGAISLVFGESGRRYGPEDLVFAQDLGRRAAVAVDNSHLYRAEQTARQEAERAQARVEFLSEATASLSAAVPDYEDTLERVANLAVPTLADLCLIDVIEEDGSIRRVAGAHAHPELAAIVKGLRRFPPDPTRPEPVLTVLRTSKPVIMTEMPSGMAEKVARDAEHLALLRAAPASALMIFPLVARNRTLGAITLVTTSSRRTYGPEDATLAQELARRAALVVDNARLYERQRHIARTLQRSLLPPSIPQIPGMELAARYRAAGEGNEVGGDFYDVFETADGAWILTIGDVCGKGPEAAAITGLARHTVRAVSLHEPRPSRVLAMLNEAILRELSDDRFCTVCCVRIRPGPDGARLTVCSGGHPLPLILRADGTLETAGHPSMLLGVLPDVELSDHAVDLGPGDTIVLITDGVIEEARGSGRSGPQRLEEILRHCRGLPASAVAEAIERSVLRFGPESPRDDFAILVLRVAAAGERTGHAD